MKGTERTGIITQGSWSGLKWETGQKGSDKLLGSRLFQGSSEN